MSRQSLSELAELAEFIAEENIKDGFVDLDAIMQSRGITYSFNSYGDSFAGLLEYKNGCFHIYLNKEKLGHRYSARARFTKAHELGHYFNDDHRNKLMQGISLSFDAKENYPLKYQIEREANHFASHLLMPKGHFLRLIDSEGHGIESLMIASKSFGTSLESTALHYTNLNTFPTLLIKWKPDLSLDYVLYNSLFQKKAKLFGLPALKINREYLKQIFAVIDKTKLSFFEEVSILSKWLATISQGSKRDLTALEQTIKLGEFGGLTLISL